jgi:tRNA (adenine57-N1/adenine58-N1)-methyltransferase
MDPQQDTFRTGDPVQLIGPKDKTFLAVLEPGKTADARGHRFAHEAIIGQPVGCALESSAGKTFWAVRPSLAQWILEMPRFATPIYPKDLGAILVHGDVHAGLTVLEAGLGSGGLALWLLRAVGPTGSVISYDVREESLEQGQKNVAHWFGGQAPPNHVVRERDVYQGIDEDRRLDRILLDVREPWEAVPHVAAALADGGVFVSYSPTVLQVHQTVKAIHATKRFRMVQSLELLERPWHVGSISVRPEQRMVGHTGFLTTARKVAALEVGT